MIRLKTLHLITFLITISMLSSFATGQNLVEENGFYRLSHKQSFRLAEGGDVDIDADRADVLVTGWDKKEIEVQETIILDARDENTARRYLNRDKTDYFERSNSLRITAGGSHGWARQSFIVFVPRKTRVIIEVNNGDVEIEDVAGDLRIRTSNGDVTLAKIRGDIDLLTSSGDVAIDDVNGSMDVHTSGGDIRLENIDGNVDGHTSGGSIRLRGGTCDAYINTSGGDIDLENITGKIEANTAGGNIEARSCQGPLRINTAGGDIDFDTVSGPVTAMTSGGDIVGDRINDQVSASTNGGDIELRRVNGAVRAETEAGEIDVEITMTDFSRAHDIFLKTRVGDIRLILPSKMPATISARISRESRRWSDHDIESDFPLPTRETNSGRQLFMEGDINGGGTKIEIEAGHGDISIEKGK